LKTIWAPCPCGFVELEGRAIERERKDEATPSDARARGLVPDMQLGANAWRPHDENPGPSGPGFGSMADGADHARKGRSPALELEVARVVKTVLTGRVGRTAGVVGAAGARGDAVVSAAEARGVRRAGIGPGRGESDRGEDAEHIGGFRKGTHGLFLSWLELL